MDLYEDACKDTQKKLVNMEKLRTSRSIQQEKVFKVLLTQIGW